MTNSFRIGIIVALFVLIIAGAILTATQRLETTTFTYSQQVAVCTENFTLALGPSQISKQTCPATKDNWVDLSLTAASNIPTNITVTVWINGTSGGAPILLYNSTGHRFSGSFPILAGGLVISQIQAVGNGTTVQGAVRVYEQTQTSVPGFTSVFPYRLYGYGLMGLSAAGIFFFVWNPRKIATKSLGRLVRILGELKSSVSRRKS